MGYVQVFPGKNYPTVRLEWAPLFGPTDTPFTSIGTPDWIDITSYWRDLQWSYGRNDELGAYEPGRGYLTLSNATRVFDPTNTGGTWYGNLKPRRPFKFSVGTAGSFVTSLFFYARGFPQSWPAQGADSVTRVELVDYMAVAGGMEFPIGYTRPEEGVSTRFSAVCADFGISSGAFTSGTAIAALSVENAGENVLTHLRDAAASEGGGVYTYNSGDLSFISKQQLILTGKSSVQRLNFTDSPTSAGSAIRYSTDTVIVQDDNYLWNAATFTGADGAIGSSAATASQGEFSPMSKSFTSLLAKNTDCEEMAQYFTYLHAQPVERIPSVTVDLLSCGTSAYTYLFSSDIGSSCRLTRYANSGTPTVLDQKVEGISHSVSPGRYLMQFAMSPADLTTYWTLETSTLGTIDTTNLIAP